MLIAAYVLLYVVLGIAALSLNNLLFEDSDDFHFTRDGARFWFLVFWPVLVALYLIAGVAVLVIGAGELLMRGVNWLESQFTKGFKRLETYLRQLKLRHSCCKGN